MKRIGITQRMDLLRDRQEWRDALDVELGKLLFDLGYLPIPLCNGIVDGKTYVESLDLDGFLLSGGNDIGTMPKRDQLESVILTHASNRKIPVFGICRGLQFINTHFGGELVAIEDHVRKRHVVKGPLIPQPRTVNSFHDYGIKQEVLAPELEAVVWAEDNSIEALRHRDLPILGIMWHPERDADVDIDDRNLILSHFA